MDEGKKIFSGKMFNTRNLDLKKIKHNAHEGCKAYNDLNEDDPKRLQIIKEILGEVGDNFHFQGPIRFNYGCHTHIGDNFFSNFNLTMMDDGGIIIGDNVGIGPNVTMVAASHPLIPQERMGIDDHGCTIIAAYSKGISIGNNVWIGCNTTILDGVHIGNNVVVGAGSVVTKSIPDGYLAYGNPCRAQRQITPSDSKMALVLEEDLNYYKYIVEKQKG